VMSGFSSSPPPSHTRPRAAASMFLPPRLAAALPPRSEQRREFVRWIAVIGWFCLLTLALAIQLAHCDSCSPLDPGTPAPILSQSGGEVVP
jgi:hypothetical protein